jgi:hypothetical protein
MTIDFESVAELPDKIHPADKFGVDMDISTWLDADTIASAVYTAVDEDGEDATSMVLETGICSETNTVLTVYLNGGTHDVWYMVKIVVTTANADDKTFYLKFHCYDWSESL